MLELLCVLAVLAISLSVVQPWKASTLQADLQAAERLVSAMLNSARAAAMAQQVPVALAAGCVPGSTASALQILQLYRVEQAGLPDETWVAQGHPVALPRSVRLTGASPAEGDWASTLVGPRALGERRTAFGIAPTEVWTLTFSPTGDLGTGVSTADAHLFLVPIQEGRQPERASVVRVNAAGAVRVTTSYPEGGP